MANTHGGARPGAGKPSNAERHAVQVATFTAKCAAKLAWSFKQLVMLAEGATRVQVTEKAAGTITRKDFARDEQGKPVLDGKGKPIPREVSIYDHLDPETLVVTGRVTITLPPEFRALEAIVNRVAGTPSPAAEPETEEGQADLREAHRIVAERRAAYSDPDAVADQRPAGDGPGGREPEPDAQTDDEADDEAEAEAADAD